MYNVLSPDGFSISFEKTYNSMQEAKNALKEWIEGFKQQGYYSSVSYGRISLYELELYCEIIEI
jgi:hypothetical protein